MEDNSVIDLIKNNDTNKLLTYIKSKDIKITSKHLFAIENNNLDMVKFLCDQGSNIDEFVPGYDVSYVIYVLSNYESYYNVDLIQYMLDNGNISVVFGENNSLDIIDVLEIVFYKDIYYDKKIDYYQLIINIKHIIDQLKVRIYFDSHFRAKVIKFFESINYLELVDYVNNTIERFKSHKYIHDKKCKKIIGRQPQIILKPHSLSCRIISIIWETKMRSIEEIFTDLVSQKSNILTYFGIMDLDKFQKIFCDNLIFTTDFIKFTQ